MEINLIHNIENKRLRKLLEVDNLLFKDLDGLKLWDFEESKEGTGVKPDFECNLYHEKLDFILCHHNDIYEINIINC